MLIESWLSGRAASILSSGVWGFRRFVLFGFLALPGLLRPSKHLDQAIHSSRAVAESNTAPISVRPPSGFPPENVVVSGFCYRSTLEFDRLDCHPSSAESGDALSGPMLRVDFAHIHPTKGSLPCPMLAARHAVSF